MFDFPPAALFAANILIDADPEHRVVVATGAGKKEILKKILEADDEGRNLPCGLVNEGAGERVSWFTDTAAVEGVSFPRRGSL